MFDLIELELPQVEVHCSLAKLLKFLTLFSQILVCVSLLKYSIKKMATMTVAVNKSVAIGFYLGTTNSAVAVFKDGKTHIIKSLHSFKNTTPSVVFLVPMEFWLESKP